MPVDGSVAVKVENSPCLTEAGEGDAVGGERAEFTVIWAGDDGAEVAPLLSVTVAVIETLPAEVGV